MKFIPYLIIPFLAIILIPLVAALNENKASITTFLSIDGQFTVEKIADPYTVNNLTINITIIPSDSFSQNVLSKNFNPRPKGDLFFYPTIEPGTYLYSVLVELRQEYSIMKIKQKVPYQSYDLPAGLQVYLQPQTYTDISPSLIYQAHELAISDDYYKNAFDAAAWVMANIEKSDLVPGDAQREQASQVFVNKKADVIGMNTLFISLLRSMNIPARLVFGLHEKGTEYVQHYWTEVYMPNIGFVPFDLWEDQIGFVDPTHLALKQSTDFNPFSVTFDAQKKINANIKGGNLDYSVMVTSSSPAEIRLAQANLYLLSSHLSPQSFTYGELVLINKNDFYLPLYIELNPQNLNIENSYPHYVLLRPAETYSIPLILKAEDKGMAYLSSLQKDFHPVNQVSSSIIIDENGTTFSKAAMMKLLSQNLHFIGTDIDKKKISSILGDELKDKLENAIEQAQTTSMTTVITKTSSQDITHKTTTINISIDPKKELYNFSIYENIPKCLAQRIDDVVFTKINVTILNPDPLVVWHFAEVKDRVDLSYELKDLKDIKDCENESLTLAWAEEIGNEIAIKSSTPKWMIIIPLLLIPIVIFILVFFSRFKKDEDI